MRHYYIAKNVGIEHFYIVFCVNLSYTINVKGKRYEMRTPNGRRRSRNVSFCNRKSL